MTFLSWQDILNRVLHKSSTLDCGCARRGALTIPRSPSIIQLASLLPCSVASSDPGLGRPMAALEQLRQALREYEVSIEYVKPLQRYMIEKPYTLGFDIALDKESSRTNLEFERLQLMAGDARDVRAKLSVETHGFEFMTIPPGCMANHFAHLGVSNEVEGVRSLLSQRFNTDKVIIYDHAVRSISPLPHNVYLTFSSIGKRRIERKKPNTPSQTAPATQSSFEIHMQVSCRHPPRQRSKC